MPSKPNIPANTRAVQPLDVVNGAWHQRSVSAIRFPSSRFRCKRKEPIARLFAIYICFCLPASEFTLEVRGDAVFYLKKSLQ